MTERDFNKYVAGFEVNLYMIYGGTRCLDASFNYLGKPAHSHPPTLAMCAELKRQVRDFSVHPILKEQV